MKPNRRKLVRSSFIALVTGAGAPAPQAGNGDSDQAGDNNGSRQNGKSSGPSDSDSH